MTERRVGEADIEGALLDLLRARPGRTVEPTEIARALVGGDPDLWGPLMPAVRRVAVRLMKSGRIVITRRGRPVDPDDFRGTYRIIAATDPEATDCPTVPGTARRCGR